MANIDRWAAISHSIVFDAWAGSRLLS